MLAAERQGLLIERLAVDGKIVAKQIADELGLSEDSVRRDLRELAAAGLCQRVYGGALPASPAVVDYASRGGLQPQSKERVARAAVRLIEAHSTVILDGGTTTLAMVRALPQKLACTIITHSPTIAAALVPHAGIEVYLIGGRLLRHSAVACGAVAMEAAQRISADLFFLGVTGVHTTEGLTTGDAEEAAMKRALAGRAADTYVLASSEKIGVASRYGVLPFGETAGIIADARSDDETLGGIRGRGTAIIDASV